MTTPSYRILDNLKTPKNEEGVVSTCRSGLKWADAQPGEILLLQDRDDNGQKRIYGKAEVVKVETAIYKHMTDEQVESNHGVHTRESLLEAMQRAYGPDFYGDCTVTVLFYKRIDLEPKAPAKDSGDSPKGGVIPTPTKAQLKAAAKALAEQKKADDAKAAELEKAEADIKTDQERQAQEQAETPASETKAEEPKQE